MNKIDFFKLQAKNFERDYKSRYLDQDGCYVYEPRFFEDIDDIIVTFDINEGKFTLMNAQHIIAQIAGFKKWSDLIRSDDDGLELGKLLFEHRNDYVEGFTLWDDWNHYLLVNNFNDSDNSFKLQLFEMLYLNGEE